MTDLRAAAHDYLTVRGYRPRATRIGHRRDLVDSIHPHPHRGDE
jgi:hypothetical protein